MCRKLLLTGFEPFGGLPQNSSWEGIREFEGVRAGGFLLFARLLPVEYAGAVRRLRELVAGIAPEAVISFGRSPHPEVRLETTARNRGGRGADNAGLSSPGEIVPGAPAVLQGSLPLEEVELRLQERGIPCRRSDDAGGYVCNHLFFHLMHEARSSALRCAGFVHVPPLGGDFSRERLQTATEGVVAAVTASLGG